MPKPVLQDGNARRFFGAGAKGFFADPAGFMTSRSAAAALACGSDMVMVASPTGDHVYGRDALAHAAATRQAERAAAPPSP